MIPAKSTSFGHVADCLRARTATVMWPSYAGRGVLSRARGRSGLHRRNARPATLGRDRDCCRYRACGRSVGVADVCTQQCGGRPPQPQHEEEHSSQVMVQIRTVDLSVLGIQLPATSVRMVVAQPYLAGGVLTPQEPYRVARDAKQGQLEVVKTTIDLAMERKADFTVIPEYGIPGLEGIAAIEEHLSSAAWPSSAIVIGGVDGLEKNEYASLVEADRTCVDETNGSDSVEDGQWVNCCITWVKSSDQRLCRWVQPKLWPAWQEQSTLHQSMFKGKSMFLFRGRRTNGEVYTFGTLVCFDWIAPTVPTPAQRFLEEAHRVADGAQLPITWVFVIQHNEKPSHVEFLSKAVDFFRDRSYPNATRNGTCLVFANTAGRGYPGSCHTHGNSGLVPRAGHALSNGWWASDLCSRWCRNPGPEWGNTGGCQMRRHGAQRARRVHPQFRPSQPEFSTGWGRGEKLCSGERHRACCSWRETPLGPGSWRRGGCEVGERPTRRNGPGRCRAMSRSCTTS